jgi:putative oxidoreductase
MQLLTADLGFTTSCVSLLLRLFIGTCFIIHAMGKLGLVGPGNMQGFESWLKSLNVPMPAIQARAAMLTEMLGGICVTLGLFTRPACLMLTFVMLVAMLIGHKGGGYLITNNPPGREYTINLAAVLIAIFMLGPGVYSLDARLF